MNESIEIRPVATTDYESLREFYEKSIRLNTEGFVQDLDHHMNLRTAADTWRSKGGELLTAWIGSDLVAMGGLAPFGDGTVELCKLHVHAKLQGRGIGRSITAEILNLADSVGFETVRLHVTTSQQAAIGLYYSLGFQATMQRVYVTDVFGSPVSFDTLYMALPLKIDLIGEPELVYG